MRCDIHVISISHPGDVSGVKKAIDNGEIKASDIIAVLGKTEGNGCVNDFTRGFMTSSLKEMFRDYLCETEINLISLVMSGGTEGVLTPHLTVITRSNTGSGNQTEKRGKALAVGVARTVAIPPEHLGRAEHIRLVEQATKAAMEEAGINGPADVHFVQVKCPLLVASDLMASNGLTITTETYKSMAYSRGASALGIGLALAEDGFNSSEELAEFNCTDFNKYSAVASTSAGAELDYCEVVVLGNSFASQSNLFICHDVMKDALDADAIKRVRFSAEKLAPSGYDIVQILAKAEADPTGTVRGFRNTMLDDSDINHTRHARSVFGAVLAAASGTPMIYVSGGAEHQGPPGGGPLAVICRRK